MKRVAPVWGNLFLVWRGNCNKKSAHTSPESAGEQITVLWIFDDAAYQQYMDNLALKAEKDLYNLIGADELACSEFISIIQQLPEVLDIALLRMLFIRQSNRRNYALQGGWHQIWVQPWQGWIHRVHLPYFVWCRQQTFLAGVQLQCGKIFRRSVVVKTRIYGNLISKKWKAARMCSTDWPVLLTASCIRSVSATAGVVLHMRPALGIWRAQARLKEKFNN